jgi:hypothetical protein
MLRARLQSIECREDVAIADLEEDFIRTTEQLDAEQDFLHRCNVGSEAMRSEDQDRVRAIGTARTWVDRHGASHDFLSEDEIKNLTIRSGTLTEEERQVINHHIDVTIQMVESLPWPRHLKNVPEYAGGHHERMDGTGRPRGLLREQLSIPARIMGIADIFEALTAGDRPYKKGKTLSEALTILGQCRLTGHIDPDLFDIFIREKVWLKFAEEFLDADQIDEVDLSRIPGYFA